MQYLDREGNRIDSLQWAKLYRNPTYSIVHASRRGNFEIITSWVGLHSEYEKQSRLFMVQVRKGTIVKVGAEKHEEFATVSEEWYATEEAAIAHHHFLEAPSCVKT
jgi:hypothetical protein